MNPIYIFVFVTFMVVAVSWEVIGQIMRDRFLTYTGVGLHVTTVAVYFTAKYAGLLS